MLRKIWLYSIHYYIKLGLFFYFRRIYSHNVSSIPKDKPVLFLANHQNALLDALLIATNNGRFSYFLTRAGVFKSKLVSRILHSLRMLPVYRVRDGWNNISNNVAIFNTCAKLFSRNEAIVIFPEGSHNLKRTVRPLSKGFTRIVFETLEKYPGTELQLIPVGLNFVNADKFSDSVSIFYGDPFFINDFISDNKNEDIKRLKSKVQLEISNLTTHINQEGYDETLSSLKALNVDFLKPQSVNNTILNNFESHEAVDNNNSFSYFKPFFKSLLIIMLIGPYTIWKFIAEPKIKEKEFTSTFRFAIAITIVPLWLLVIGVFLATNFGWLVVLEFLITVLLVNLLAVKL